MDTLNTLNLYSSYPSTTTFVEYLNDWIDNATNFINYHQSNLDDLQLWRKMSSSLIQKIPTLDNKLKNIENLQIEGNQVISLSQLGAIKGLFKFDDEGAIISASIVPESIEKEKLGDQNKLVVTDESGVCKTYNTFTGNTEDFLSGDGTWQKIPKLENEAFVQPIKRDKLIELRTQKKLVAGVWYRITDYDTIVLFKDATSVSINVDILMLALSSTTLSENVYFLKNTNDTTDYLNASNVSVWKGKYCIDNDVKRFDFINGFETYIETYDGAAYVRYSDWDIESSNLYAWRAITSVFDMKQAFEKNNSDLPYLDECVYTNTLDISPEKEYNKPFNNGHYYSPYLDNAYEGSLLINDLGHITGKRIKSVYPVSKGVIYHLEDEYGNSAPYDFKSIIFTWGTGDNVQVQGYTFTKFENDDYTIGKEASLQNSSKVYRNTISELYTELEEANGQKYKRHSLNKICHNVPCVYNYYWVDCSDIFILGESSLNTWEGNSNHNKFYKDVHSNTFSFNFQNNIFTIPVKNNIFKAYNTNNRFTLKYHDNKQKISGKLIDESCSNNTFGQYFQNNTMSIPIINNNNIGINVQNNTFEGTVEIWKDNAYTYENTLYYEDSKNLVNCVIQNNFKNNTVKGLFNAIIGENIKTNTFCSMCNVNMGNNIISCNIQNADGLILQGNNTNIQFTGPKLQNTTIEYGVSYLKCFDYLVNANIKRGVAGKAKELLVINGTGSNPTSVTNYVTQTNEVYVNKQVDTSSDSTYGDKQY